MKLHELCDALDAYFNVSAFDEKDWLDLISEAERGAFLRFLRPEYVQGSWNGLMLENTSLEKNIERVYLLVYPNQEVLDTIIAREVERGAPGALIFCYQPIAYHEDKAEFQIISTAQLEALKEHYISIYTCHAPLDCHTEVSTAGALADALGLEEQARFGEHYGGLGCIHGHIHATSYENLATRLAEISELPYLRYDQLRHNGRSVEHIAIAPGGIHTPFMDEASRLGVDTFITGHWWLYGSSGFAANSRERMSEYIANTKMNLIGTTRYSNALVVMRDYVPDVFRSHNIETIFVRQKNHWQ